MLEGYRKPFSCDFYKGSLFILFELQKQNVTLQNTLSNILIY